MVRPPPRPLLRLLLPGRRVRGAAGGRLVQRPRVLPRHPPGARHDLHPLAREHAARSGRHRALPAPPPPGAVLGSDRHGALPLLRRGLPARLLFPGGRRGGGRARPGGAGYRLRGAGPLPGRPPLVFLPPAPRAARAGAAARGVPAGAALPLPPAPPLQDTEPARGGHDTLAGAPALRHADPVHRAPRGAAARLLLRRPAGRRGAPRAEPGRVGLHLPPLRPGSRAGRLQPGGAPRLHADERHDRAHLPAPGRARARLRAPPACTAAAAPLTVRTTSPAASSTGPQPGPGRATTAASRPASR